MSKNRKPEKHISSERARISLRARGGRVVGLVARIADPKQKNGFEPSGADLTGALGAVTLEALGVILDPIKRELRPLPMILA